MLQVVVDKCKFAPDMSNGLVVIECDQDRPPFTQAFHELQAPDARLLAQKFATEMGMFPANIGGQIIGPYPVNAEGHSLDSLKDSSGNSLPYTDPAMEPARYRVEVPVCRPIR